jgi:hypothetical protein
MPPRQSSQKKVHCVRGIDGARQARRHLAQELIGQAGAGAAVRLLGERVHQRVGIAHHLLGLVAIDARDVLQHVDERRPAVHGDLRKVGAAPKRARVAVEEHGQRPAALLPDAVQGAHVDGVDVRALLAVDLDVHEVIVHHPSRHLVLEALVRHHVAPVAGRVADREQDRLAGPLGLGQGLGAPGPPVHRVVAVLEKVGAALVAQAVAAHASVLLVLAAGAP